MGSDGVVGSTLCNHVSPFSGKLMKEGPFLTRDSLRKSSPIDDAPHKYTCEAMKSLVSGSATSFEPSTIEVRQAICTKFKSA